MFPLDGAAQSNVDPVSYMCYAWYEVFRMAKETAAKGKTKVAVWIEDAHVKALEEVKKAHGTPVSESIRRALTEYFAKKRV